jgi:S1-C subfamily serine protease
MTKFGEWIEKNGIKTLVTMIIVCAFFLQIVYLSGIRNDISILQKRVTTEFTTSNATQDMRFELSLQIYSTILEALENVINSNQFIIDQNRAREQKIIEDKKTEETKKIKPTYEELKSHTVYVIGCSEKDSEENNLTYPISNDSSCWSGTGVIVKITDTETYILTNNHVAAKNMDNPSLYVENKSIPAKVVKYHSYVDAAVIKIQGKLKNKTPIPGIATANIQDPVYVVGNPLGVKNVYSEGLIAGYEGISILIQMPLIYGSSGSGVYDKNGNLVGLVYALEMYHGFFGIPEARITHSVIVDSVSIKVFLKDLGLLE